MMDSPSVAGTRTGTGHRVHQATLLLFANPLHNELREGRSGHTIHLKPLRLPQARALTAAAAGAGAGAGAGASPTSTT